MVYGRVMDWCKKLYKKTECPSTTIQHYTHTNNHTINCYYYCHPHRLAFRQLLAVEHPVVLGDLALLVRIVRGGVQRQNQHRQRVNVIRVIEQRLASVSSAKDNGCFDAN